jgi:hypothetical protein
VEVNIRLAETQEDRHKVYRFRYGVYVQEMNVPQSYADHAQKIIVEPLDHQAIIMAAFVDDAVVGTIRANTGRDSDLAYYPELYGMKDFARSAYPDRTSITTKFMVAAEYRNTTLAYRLAASIYRLGLEDNILYNFIDCKAEHASFYQMLGYRPYRGTIRHPEIGNEALPLVLPLTDLEYLAEVRSPFVKVAKSCFQQGQFNQSLSAGLPGILPHSLSQSYAHSDFLHPLTTKRQRLQTQKDVVYAGPTP